MGSIAPESSTSQGRPYPPGIHVPSLTWFKDDPKQSIDWDVQEQHLEFLVRSGLHGIVIAGTNGEAATLELDEKLELVRRTRSIGQKLGRPDLPITVGCNGGCTHAVIEDTKAAAGAGADFALVLVPSYFHFAMSSDAIVSFFQETADQSPIPIVVYNFPGVVAGLDVNSEMLDVLGEHPNIVAVKLTCGGIAKVARAAAKFGAFGKTESQGFRVLAGQSDWLVPALSVGGAGSVTGLANLYPKTCIEIYDLYMAGKREEAEKLQLELAKCEVGFGMGGINGTKWVVARSLEYPESSSACRRPYPLFSDEKKKSWITAKVEVLKPIEASLTKAVK